MKLVPISRYIPTYINIEYIVTVTESLEGKKHHVTTVDGKEYSISKESFEVILKYGKMEI